MSDAERKTYADFTTSRPPESDEMMLIASLGIPKIEAKCACNFLMSISSWLDSGEKSRIVSGSKCENPWVIGESLCEGDPHVEHAIDAARDARGNDSL